MFEDIIPEKFKKYLKPDIYENRDSLVEALKDNVKLKEDHINDLLNELSKRQSKIDDLQKEIDYLTDI